MNREAFFREKRRDLMPVVAGLACMLVAIIGLGWGLMLLIGG